MTSQIIEYDFCNEYILYSLSQLFKSNYTEEQSFFKHSLDNFDYYRNIKQENVIIIEESLFIRIKIHFNALPLIQVIINKENHKLCRVYVSNDEKKLGKYFYINDNRIIELINLSTEVQRRILINFEQIKKDEIANSFLISNSIHGYLNKLVIEKNQLNKIDMNANLFPTFYGVCLILEVFKSKQLQNRYRFLREDFKNSSNNDIILKNFIQNKINSFIKIVKPENYDKSIQK